MSRRIDPDAHWHLDKRVPISLIVTILIQTAVIVWWAAGTAERINVLEKQAAMSAPQGDRLTRVEVKLDAVQESVGEIKRLIQQRR